MYDENACYIHVQKFQVFVDEPKKFLTTVNVESQFNFGKLDIFNTFTKSGFDFEQNLFNELNQNPNKKNNLQLQGKAIKKEKKGKKKNQFNLNQILSNSLSIFRKLSKDPSYNPMKMIISERVNLLKELIFSGWNPPVSQRKFCGDFFYIRAITVEEKVLHITAFTHGFYVNKCTDDKYDPSPSSKAYNSLLALFDDFSEKWVKEYSLVMQDANKLDIFEVETCDSKKPIPWLTQPATSELQYHTNNTTRAAFYMNDLFGMNPKIYRDWNEEVFNCRLMPGDHTMEKINR